MASHSPKQQTAERELKTSGGAHAVSAELRRKRIAEAAYYLSQRRAAAGADADDVQDWLEAERTIDEQIAAASSRHHHGSS